MGAFNNSKTKGLGAVDVFGLIKKPRVNIGAIGTVAKKPPKPAPMGSKPSQFISTGKFNTPGK